MDKFLSKRLRRFGIGKRRLEMIVRDCWKCEKKTVYVYLGNYGTKYNPKHTYECSKCEVHYTTSEKLKEGKNDR